MNSYLMTTLYLLIPFTIYGVFIFSRWWFKMVWNKPASFGVVMIIGPLSATWAVYTLVMIHNHFPLEMMPIYALWTIFAPISMIVSFASHIKVENKKIALT